MTSNKLPESIRVRQLLYSKHFSLVISYTYDYLHQFNFDTELTRNEMIGWSELEIILIITYASDVLPFSNCLTF